MPAKRIKIGNQPYALIPLRPGWITTVRVSEVHGELKIVINEKQEVPETVKDYGAFKIYPSDLTVEIGGQRYRLTRQSFAMFCFMAENQRVPLSFASISEAGDLSRVDSKRSANAAIHRVKVGLGRKADKWFVNDRTNGYSFEPPQ